MKEYMKNKKRGFTLIELLVVIAIIGILTSVVLASLTGARSKGGDAAVKANLAGVRTSAELYENDNKSYGIAVNPAATSINTGCTQGMFASDNNIKSAIDEAVRQGGGASWCGATVTPAAYAVAVPLKSTPGTFWCVDSTGIASSTIKSSPISSSAKCDF